VAELIPAVLFSWVRLSAALVEFTVSLFRVAAMGPFGSSVVEDAIH
jgi:hypothetical protein